MGRRPNAATISAALALLGTILALSSRAEAAPSSPTRAGTSRAPSSGIKLDQKSPSALVLQTAIYRLTLSKRNGGLIQLLDRTCIASLSIYYTSNQKYPKF